MKRICLLLAIFFVLFFWGYSSVLADCNNGICESTDITAECLKDCDEGDPCAEPNCSKPKPAPICCRPGVTCPEDKPVWTYAHSPQCIVDYADPFGLLCSWHWQYTYCKSLDTCKSEDPYYLYAGLCGDGGCEVGGRYKVCCKEGKPVKCEGGQFTGVCPAGSTAEFCGFDTHPSCDDPDAVCGGGMWFAERGHLSAGMSRTPGDKQIDSINPGVL